MTGRFVPLYLPLSYLNNNVTSCHDGSGCGKNNNNNNNNNNDDDSDDAFDLVKNWIRRVNKKEADAGYFILRLDDGSIDKNTVRSILEKHENSNSQAGLASLKKKLKVWAKLPSYLYYQCFFYTNLQLKEQVLELNGRANVTGKNKDVLLDLVADCKRTQRQRNTMVEGEEEEDPFNDIDTVYPLLHDILKASKPIPLGNEAKKYCQEGHLLERPFLEQFH